MKIGRLPPLEYFLVALCYWVWVYFVYLHFYSFNFSFIRHLVYHYINCQTNTGLVKTGWTKVWLTHRIITRCPVTSRQSNSVFDLCVCVYVCVFICHCKDNLTLYSHLHKWLILLTAKSFLFFSICFLNMKKETNFVSVILKQEQPFFFLVGHCIWL